MKKMILAAILPLAACGAVTLDGTITEKERAIYTDLRAAAVQQIIAYNEMGFNPLQLGPLERAGVASACLALTQGTIIVSGSLETAQEVASFCAVLQLVAE